MNKETMAHVHVLNYKINYRLVSDLVFSSYHDLLKCIIQFLSRREVVATSVTDRHTTGGIDRMTVPHPLPLLLLLLSSV